MTALGFDTKEELYNIIADSTQDEDEARRIFTALDEWLLVPNELTGLIDERIEEFAEKAEATTNSDQNTENNTKEPNPQSIQNTNKDIAHTNTESAEDILREIENPTPSPLIIQNQKTQE